MRLYTGSGDVVILKHCPGKATDLQHFFADILRLYWTLMFSQTLGGGQESSTELGVVYFS